MITSTTDAAVQVDIPNECAMQADVTPDIDLQFQLGEPGRGVQLTFERVALERFLHLAFDLLAAPWPDGEPGEAPQLGGERTEEPTTIHMPQAMQAVV